MNLCLVVALFLAESVSRAVADGSCPPDVCAEYYPAVQDGKIVMKIYYDNDNPYEIFQWNANVVNMACDALDALGSQLLVLDFKMGASTSICPTTNELSCKADDCYVDRLEACASKYVPDFPKFACCNNRGKSYYKCADEQGVSREDLDYCVQNHESDQILLDNSKERAEFAELPLCYLPDVLFNDRNDRCIKFYNSYQLIQNVLCGMYNDAGMSLQVCKG